VERTRRNVTLLVLAGVLVPPALAVVGYLAAGSPHVECGDTRQTEAFYRVAAPVFMLAGLSGAAALVLIARTRADEKRHWLAESLAVLTALVALDAVLPGNLHDPGRAVVVVLGIFGVIAWFITWPVALGLLAVAGTKLVRRRGSEAPARPERCLYLFLIGWLLATVLPTLIVLLSLNADPLCFTF
jgi:hypothetical protein